MKKGMLVVPGRTMLHKYMDPIAVEVSLMHKSEDCGSPALRTVQLTCFLLNIRHRIPHTLLPYAEEGAARGDAYCCRPPRAHQARLGITGQDPGHHPRGPTGEFEASGARGGDSVII